MEKFVCEKLPLTNADVPSSLSVRIADLKIKLLPSKFTFVGSMSYLRLRKGTEKPPLSKFKLPLCLIFDKEPKRVTEPPTLPRISFRDFFPSGDRKAISKSLKSKLKFNLESSNPCQSPFASISFDVPFNKFRLAT